MSRAGLLLRIVLSVSLVLNGITGSLAATAMVAAPEASAPETASVAPAKAAPHPGCHDHASMPHQQQPTTDPAPKAPGGQSDCCGVGLCGCACAQLSSLAAIDLRFVPSAISHEQLSDAVTPSHASPALPDLIRPPIV